MFPQLYPKLFEGVKGRETPVDCNYYVKLELVFYSRNRVVLELPLNTEKITLVFKAIPSQKADPLKTQSPTLCNGCILSRELP